MEDLFTEALLLILPMLILYSVILVELLLLTQFGGRATGISKSGILGLLVTAVEQKRGNNQDNKEKLGDSHVHWSAPTQLKRTDVSGVH